MPELATISVDSDDDLEALIEQSVREKWGDGLPFVPPTAERVERALARIAIDPDHPIGVVQPSGATATVRNVTVNAIMAGCSVSHLPLVFAVTEAICNPLFNLRAIQVTTHPVGVAGFVSGPLAAAFGVNAGGNAFGPGNRANATVGRAIRLVMLNIGGGIPGLVDKATFGSPAKYTWFFAERQEQSPWPSWVERSGAAGDSSTVTVFGAGGFLNLMETTSSADQLLDAFALSMAAPNNNDHLLCGEPLLVLCPEHARVLSSGGYSVADVQRRLWETARLPVRSFTMSARTYRLGPTWTDILGELTEESLIPPSRDPEHIRIVVSGGSGRHSVYVPSTGATPSCSASLDPYAQLLKA